jgi:hypothetical protein
MRVLQRICGLSASSIAALGRPKLSTPNPESRLIYTAHADAKSLSGTRAPLGHQNQPPDGTTPLRRRYVTRLP